MKFNANDFDFYTPFGDLNSGDTFYYEPSGVIWMKLFEDADKTFSNNAVALDDGVIGAFNDDESVIKVDVECKITFSPKTLDN